MMESINKILSSDSFGDKVNHWMYLAAVPALSISVINDNEFFSREFNTALLKTSNDYDKDIIYYAASLTKPVFAYMILKCIQEGLLSLDRPIHEYYPLPNPKDPNSNFITTRHILSHSTGWVNWRNNASQELVSEFTPGTDFNYSGEGYFFLQRVIEYLTGKSVSSLLREYVFQPLSMRNSSLAWLPELDLKRVRGHNNRGIPVQETFSPVSSTLASYSIDKGVSIESLKTEDSEKALRESMPNVPVLPNFLKPNAASSLMTTAKDYALFLRHLVKTPDKTTRDILNLMSTPQVSINDELKWGIGTGLEINQDEINLWHWGDNPGYKNFFTADSNKKTALIVFTASDNGKSVYERLIRELTGVDHQAFFYYR